MVIDARALMWVLVTELYRELRVPSDAGALSSVLSHPGTHSDVKAELARLATLGEPQLVRYATCRLIAYLRAHGCVREKRRICELRAQNANAMAFFRACLLHCVNAKALWAVQKARPLESHKHAAPHRPQPTACPHHLQPGAHGGV